MSDVAIAVPQFVSDPLDEPILEFSAVEIHPGEVYWEEKAQYTIGVADGRSLYLKKLYLVRTGGSANVVVQIQDRSSMYI